MKAFSFSAILKNFGKQLSSLASQMPWCNLRFNLGSMSVVSRVNPLFSRTSFGTSPRASHFAAMIFAVLVMSIANIGMAWGDDYKETYSNPTGTNTPARANGMGAFSTIGSATGDVSFGNSSLQINSNEGSGTFTVSSTDGSYIESITFTQQSSYPINTLTSSQGTVTGPNSNVFTFTPNSAKLTSATFSMSAQSSKKVRLAPIEVNLTSDYEYFSKNFSISSGTVSCTKSNESSDITITSTGGTSNNGLTLANTKALTIASSGHNIKAIHFTCESHNTMSNLSANTGTYSSNSWTKGESTNSVTFTSKGSNATIVGISVELESTPPETWVVAGQWDSYSTSTNTLTGSGTLSTTISLAANKRYEFKIVETVGNTWYGNSGAIIGDMTNWTMATDKNNCRLHTGPAGDYTFTFDPDTKNLSVTYPSVTHPSDYYVYFKNSDVWGTVYGFMTGGSGDFAGWPGTVTNTTTICGETYHYGALLNNDGTYNKIIFNNGSSGYGNQTSDLTMPGAGKYNANRDANWHDFTTYTISFANGGGTGTMSAITGICPNSNQEITANAFEKTGYMFNCWHADKAVKVGGNTIAIGGDIAGGATLQNISQNITLTAQWTAVQYDVTLEKGSAPAAGSSGSAKVLYDASALTNISHATWAGHVLTGYYTSNSGGTKVLNADGSFAAANVSGYITDNKWTRAENTTLKAQWTCVALTLVLDGDPATPAGGSPIGTEYTLTCSASTGAIASYSWKQNTTASTTGAVDAEGTGATTASFSPVPAAAGTYYYYCVATDACDNSVNTPFSGAFTFTAPVVPYATSIDFEAIIDESGTGAAWKTTMEGRNYTLTQADGSKWSLDGGDSGNKPADKGLKIKETGDNAGKIAFTVRANQTVELKVGTLAGTGSGVAKFSTDGGSSYSNITGAATASTGVSVVTTYTGATDRTYVFKTNSASWNILQHIIIGYKITYDKGANGTGTIDPMYKTHGTNINLSSSTFTYAGHTQDGWSTSDGGSKVYELGASYTSDAPITLYPHWVEEVVVPTITATKTSPDYVSPDPNNVVLSISTTGASSGWYYRVKNTGTTGYQTPDNTPYNTATWTMTSGLALGENNFVVELYNGSGVKQAESGTITVTAEKAYPITIAAGAGGSVSPSGEIKANESGNHIHPAITATPNSGYHFVNWTCSNSNATVADASSASTTVNDARGACTITANFEADAPVATPMVIWNLNVGTSANTTIKNNVSTTDETNITDIDIDQTNDGANGAGASNRTTKLALATGESAASVDNPDKYVLFTFKVACGKKLTPSEVKIKVANVGSSAGGNQNYKAVLSDAYGHSISNTFTGTKGDGTVEEFSITNGGGTYFQGNVTLKLWSCKGASGNASAFRMGTPLTIYGVIGDEATPAATITWNTQPANGQVGDADFAYAVSCSDGSAVTVTSANEAIATIVDGKLHYVAEGTTHLVATATDACGNTITQNSNDFTVTAASVDPDPEPGDCEDLVNTSAKTSTELNTPIGEATLSNPGTGNSSAIKLKSSGYIELSPKARYSFEEGDKLLVTIYNQASGNKTTGFKIGTNEYTVEINGKSNYTFEETLTAANIVDGKVKIMRHSSDGWFVSIIIQRCAQLPSCTTPVLSDLEDQKVCPGSNVEWTANITNTATLQDGEIFAYQWNKKGNSTVLSSDATLTLNDVTEATGGTYVVTATVSADGKASKTASKEVTLTVTPATATPTITANANTIYTGNSVTLTATCASSGVGYQWYTCTDAEGTNPQAIDDAKNAEYTPSTATVGTYYYKVIVTGDGTHSCGTGSMVYTLTVSAAAGGDCETYYFFATAADATTNGVTQNKESFFTGASEGTNNNSTSITVDGNNLSITKRTSASAYSVVFTIPSGATATLYTNAKANNASYPLTITRSSDSESMEVTDQTTLANYTLSDIPEGTWTLSCGSGKNWYYGAIIVKVCSGTACTDPEVIATVDNATVCEDTENVTFTATNYADGASFQWQKKDGNAWENIDATSATYTISPVTTEHAGQYRVIATKGCSRTSEELTLTVLTAPEFNAFANTASVMKGNALTINDVEATNATDYTWYKSADNSFDVAADTKVGTTKELLLAASSITEEADQAFYLFCVASNSCGSTTSGAITVNVTALVEEECATKGNEGEHDFSFENTSCSGDTYGDSKTPVWKTNSRSKYLTYTAPEGKYFATAKVTVAHSEKTKCGYAYSTNGGTTWTFAELDGLSTTLNAITIDLPENVNTFRISRNLQDGNEKDWGVTSGTFYLAEACFTYENACTPTSVTPTTTSFEYNISTPADFEEPPFTVKHGEDIVNDAVLTYTSSNPAIATVDEDGSVTFEGMTGTVTITAAYAGTTIDEIEYCASEGSYTITVLCTDQAPTIKEADGTNLDGCNNSITLEAKDKDGNSFTGGTYQWYRDGEAIEGATSASYEVVRAGTYTVSRTYTCTTMSSNSAVVTNENPEPKVERLTPFQYYHVDKDYSDQMKDRHLFAVTSYGTLDGKRYHLTATRNGETLVLSSSTAFFTIPSSDNAVDTVMIDLDALTGKYEEGDEIVITCAPINNCNQVSTITSSITIHVIGQTPTLALICSGANGDGTRETDKLVVGGDFLTGYNKADLCQQTGNQTFNPNIEWGFYTLLKEDYIVTPVNGYAQFNKLNYEPFDILLLTDYPKSSKSEAAQKIIDDMAELCDYRPLLSFKTHFQSDKWKDKTTGEYKYTKWVKKGFTTAPVVPKQTATYVNIVCYAHPMFEDIDDINDQYTFHDDDDPNQLVYQVLTGPGYEGKKGIQGFELADADNFVTIGLVHYNAIAEEVPHDGHTHISWNAEANDRLLVAMAERQTNIEARMMLFSLNCGAQSLQTPGGRNVILQCLKYLLETNPLKVADCRMTFDNGAGNTDFDPNNYEGTGTRGDGLWSTAANWGPDYLVVPGRNNDVRIAAPCTVDGVKTKVSVGNEVQETIQYYPEVLSIHITENGSLTIPANSSLTARSTILRADENGKVYPTNVADISLGSNAGGNASLILNNERGDTKAGVAMYSKAKAGTGTTWQYIGTPHSDVSNATYNYYDSWIYSWNPSAGWEIVPTGGAVYPWVGYCITHPEQGHTYWMEGTLVETTTQEIEVPSNSYQIIGNSWTAPIQIANFEETDFEGIETKTIYFFNTGTDPEGEGSVTENATGDARWAPGTYIPVPIHSAEYTGEDTEIPSMQGFYVANNNPTSAGTLHLDYERHVRAPRKNTPSGPMHAPARVNAKDDEPIVAKLLVRGKRYDDKLILLEREDFTGGYDSGWDGDKWDGGTISPTIWAVNEIGGADAVAAIPEFEGTVIGFRAGEDNIYTIYFDYDGMEEALYLLDTETKIYTRVLKGNSYTFACPDKAEHNRFILTRKAPQIATGTENINTGENAKAVKFIKDDKIFIFVNGILYDATGKMVER